MQRIQKLLFEEYEVFNETVLIESPFAQVSENGIGIRAVQIGLTRTKLIIAVDILPNLKTNMKYFHKTNKDPEIECLELASVWPLEMLSLVTFREGSRILLKVELITLRTLFFEFGGYFSVDIYFDIWTDLIRAITNRHFSSTSTISWERIPSHQRIVEAEIHARHSAVNIFQQSERSNESSKSFLNGWKRLKKIMIGKNGDRIYLKNNYDSYGESHEQLVRQVAEYVLAETHKELDDQKNDQENDEETDDSFDENCDEIFLLKSKRKPYHSTANILQLNERMSSCESMDQFTNKCQEFKNNMLGNKEIADDRIDSKNKSRIAVKQVAEFLLAETNNNVEDQEMEHLVSDDSFTL